MDNLKCGVIRMRREAILDQQHLRMDSRGIARNRQLAGHINEISIEILDHGYFIGGSQWNQFNVVSPFTRLYYMIADSGWLETDQGRIDLLPGQMYLIPPNTRVNLRTDGRIEKLYFHVNCRFAKTDILDGINRCFTLPLLDSLLKPLLAAYQDDSLTGLLAIKGLVYGTLAEFMRERLPDLSGRLALASRYQKLYAHVEENLSAGLSARTVCSALGEPYETLRRQFRRDNGITLHQYILGRLIQLAAMQLLMTDRTIQEIAGRLGFQDEFYFSRLFKQKMEYSPREYRRINAVLRL